MSVSFDYFCVVLWLILVSSFIKEKTHLIGWALRMYSVADLRVEKKGFEPSTSWLPVKRSSQLSYIPFFDKTSELQLLTNSIYK